MDKLTDQARDSHDAPLILIVDDEITMRRLLSTILARDGYKVVEAEDGAQAISIFESLQPDLVLLDAMMPLMDGFATCAHLRTLPASEGTPILMVTALTDNEAVERAFEVGSTDYIIKPVHKAVLRHRVRHLVRAKQAEDALRRSERLYRAIVEDQTEFICRFLPNGVLTFVNEVYCRYLDRKPQELIGYNFMPLISTEDIDLVEQHLASLNLDNPVESIEYRVNKPAGEIGWHQWTHRLIFDDQGHLIELQGVGRDVTERKQMETRLLNAQKLADLGTLAAGVAHEINSPLQVITGLSRSLIDRLGQGEVDPAHFTQKLETIRRNGWRCAEIVRSLRTYAHASATQLELYDLNALVQDTLLLIEHQLKSWSNISVTTDLVSDLPPLLCDRNQITQALINLLTNARDAMPETGDIIIRTNYEAKTSRLILQVADTGSGIPPSVQSKIFDPFFTTKPVGKGTGLGLSIITGIVNAYGGEIKVDSMPEQGTTFTIFFPANPLPVVAYQTTATGRFDDTVYPSSRVNGLPGNS